MMNVQNSAVRSQTKAVSVLLACVVCSLVVSTAVVTYVAKWLLHS